MVSSGRVQQYQGSLDFPGTIYQKRIFQDRISLIFESQCFTEKIWGISGLTFLFPSKVEMVLLLYQ